jgi:hypothetical protein
VCRSAHRPPPFLAILTADEILVSALHNFLVAMRQMPDNTSGMQDRSQEIVSQGSAKTKRWPMSDIWDTKDGRRRVRRDPPTVEEAVQAAQGLTEELSEQIEIVASLMDVSSEEARGAVLRLGQRKDVNRFTIAGRAGAQRAVVVERRVTRRPLRTGSIGR